MQHYCTHFRHLKRYLFPLVVTLSCFLAINAVYADPFYPTWKHLDSNGKQLYMSGYLHGLRDAEEVVAIAKDYVKKNPTLALQTLDKVQRLCSISDISSGLLVPEIDSYYSNIENQQATLSLAVSSAERKVRTIK